MTINNKTSVKAAENLQISKTILTFMPNIEKKIKKKRILN